MKCENRHSDPPLVALRPPLEVNISYMEIGILIPSGGFNALKTSDMLIFQESIEISTHKPV